MTTQQAITLKETLEVMFDHIAKKQVIMEQLEQIEKLHQEIALTAPPMLDHYLKRRSYAKALEFLKDVFIIEEPTRPKCDHRFWVQ